MTALDIATKTAATSSSPARTPTSFAHKGLSWVAIFLLLFTAAFRLPAAPTPSKEYQLKAVFLFNFAQFVDWPADAFANPQSPLVIGILGDDPFGQNLDELVRGEKVNNRPLVIERYRRVSDIKDCQILYISQSESGRMSQILADLKGRNILTVGDSEEFARRGGIIRFVTENGKIRFRINADAAKAANLTLSSKLLRPAEVVTSGDK